MDFDHDPRSTARTESSTRNQRAEAQTMPETPAQRSVDDSPRVQELTQLQARLDSAASPSRPTTQAKGVGRGLPDGLKSGIEAASSLAMDDVTVHYDSPEPAQLQAAAFARGSEIHLGPGQERHLPHEAWHVVQQKQGRVSPTTKVGGVGVNDDRGLEREADRMGAKALQMRSDPSTESLGTSSQPGGVVQRLPPEVLGRLDELSQDPEFSNATFFVNAISAWLEAGGIPHRLGGSLAGKLHGGARDPRDVDLEVREGAAVRATFERLLDLDGRPVTFRGVTRRVRAVPLGLHENLSAVVRLVFEGDHGEALPLDVDITNENNFLFNAGLRSPAEREVSPGFGELVGNAELVISLLDRMRKRPGVSEGKGDARQIISLLAGAGFDPGNRADVEELRQKVLELVAPDQQAAFLEALEELIRRAIEA